jgi:hypothetical protein
LRLEEIMRYGLDAINLWCLRQSLRLVFEDQFSGKLWECLLECDALVAKTTANVNKYGLALEAATLLFE